VAEIGQRGAIWPNFPHLKQNSESLSYLKKNPTWRFTWPIEKKTLKQRFGNIDHHFDTKHLVSCIPRASALSTSSNLPIQLPILLAFAVVM
jgi:hypothetical protein